jgi:hypothetical protein
MSTRWVCDFCGYEGSTAGDVPPDQIQCPMCGEPVTPLPLGGMRPSTLPVTGLLSRPDDLWTGAPNALS